MFVVAVNVKHSLVALSQVSQSSQYQGTVFTNIAGHNAHRTGGTPGPDEFSPGFYM
jgi:hypothetical protein